jgi:hypothetical protein
MMQTRAVQEKPGMQRFSRHSFTYLYEQEILLLNETPGTETANLLIARIGC